MRLGKGRASPIRVPYRVAEHVSGLQMDGLEFPPAWERQIAGGETT